ncbi:phosphodiester glycosidase family protein [Streptomyces sp. NPDC018045]|uniref:phosphodiester glycosidase family protein n=1 Tax=Streptomyces sp. NPDC018045 TaxID=3365037 RepID=UPI003798989E
MKHRFVRARAVLTALTVWSVLAGSGAASGATADAGAPRLGRAVRVAPGVTYSAFDVVVGRGSAHGHLLTVDLTDRRVAVDLLYPGVVGARAPVSELADARRAVAAVNADFFNITETQHPGVEATGAPVGPAIASGRHLKAAVPDGQRFGPALPPGTDTKDVIGVGFDRRARLDRLALRGAVVAAGTALPLRGLNQYALPVNGIGAFTSRWGPTSRVRSTCGTDTDRAAPCSTETYEVTVRQGRVTKTAQVPGRGGIPRGTTTLVGREEGARHLRKLHLGDRVRVGHALVGRRPAPLRFAVGGHPIVRGDEPLAGLDAVTPAVRTSAGVGAGGRRLLLLALDGAPGRAGMTVRELADLMDRLGARDAVNLDGGGSSTLVTREPGSPGATVRNHPSAGAERPVPNAIGVFARG